MDSESALKVVYVDNEVFISDSPGVGSADRKKAFDSLGALGLPFHEIQDDQRVVNNIGLELDGNAATCRLSSVKRWRLRLAERAIRRRPFLSGAQLEVLIGHFTFAMLLNRPTLSIFRAVYDFIRKCYHSVRRLWPSVVRELRLAAGTLSFLEVRWNLPWSTGVCCADA